MYNADLDLMVEWFMIIGVWWGDLGASKKAAVILWSGMHNKNQGIVQNMNQDRRE